LTASHRWASLADRSATAQTARGSLRLLADRRLTLGADLGLVRTRDESVEGGPDRTRATGGGSASLKVGSRASVGINAAKEVFDETATLIVNGIEVATVGAEAEIELGRGAALAVGGHRASITGGTVDNVRRALSASLRWRPRRGITLSLAGRNLGYDASPRDGYFSPRRFRVGELAVRWAPGRDLGWGGFLEGALGGQYVRFAEPGDSKPTQRVGAGIAYRPSPGNELSVEYGFSNVAGAGSLTGSLYHAHVLSARARIRF
jgi:hypothetical protein